MFKDTVEPIISFIGSGGKTSLLTYFGECISRWGEKVVFSTTTKVFPLGLGEIPLLVEGDRAKRAAEAGRLLQDHFMIQVAAGWEESKLVGLEPETVSDLLQAGADRVLVEADGARGLPFKFPASYEPVLPDPAGMIFLVVGAWALGQPFSGEVFHRAELARKYLGWKEGELIEGEHITDLLLHAESYLPRLRGQRVNVVLNGIRGLWQENEARRIGTILMREGLVEKIFITNLKHQPFLWKLLAQRQE